MNAITVIMITGSAITIIIAIINVVLLLLE